MSWKKIVTLLAILAVLGVAIYFVTQQEKQKLEQEGKLFSLPPDKIAKLELQRGDKRFVFLRSGMAWNLEEPIKTIADKSMVESIIDNFGALKYDKLIEKEARNLKNYGLDQPRIRLDLYEAGAVKPAYSILIGMKNEIDQSSYARLGTGSEVVMIASYKIGNLEKELFDFRNKRFAGFESTEVAALAYNYEGSAFTFAKKENRWLLEKPIYSVADDNKISEIVGKTAGLEAKAFKENAGADKLKEYGFDKPLIELQVTLKSGSKTIKVVKKDEKYYAQCSDFSEICEIDKEFIDKFSKEVNELRSHKIAQFYSFDVRELALKTPQLQLQLKKNKDGEWESASSTPKGKIKSDQVNSLLTAIEEISATDFIDQPAKETKFIYDIRMKVADAGGGGEKSLQILLSDAQGDVVIARNPELPYQFKIAKEILDKLPKSNDVLIEGPPAKTEPGNTK